MVQDSLYTFIGKYVVITFVGRDMDDQLSGILADVSPVGVIIRNEDGDCPTFVPFSAIENMTLGW